MNSKVQYFLILVLLASAALVVLAVWCSAPNGHPGGQLPKNEPGESKKPVQVTWNNPIVLPRDPSPWKRAGYVLEGVKLGEGEVGLERLVAALKVLPEGTEIVIRPRTFFPGGLAIHNVGGILPAGPAPEFRDALLRVAIERHFALRFLPETNDNEAPTTRPANVPEGAVRFSGGE